MAQNHPTDPSPDPREPRSVLSVSPSGTANGAANGTHANGGKEIAWNDPNSRALLDALLASLQNGEERGESERRSPVRAYLGVLRRRWKPMLLLLALIAGGVTWRLKPGKDSYTAIARMQLPPAPTAGTGGMTLDTLGIPGASGGKADTQIAVVTSPPLIKRALTRLPAPLRERGWGSPDDNGAPTTPGAVSNERPSETLPLKSSVTLWNAWWNPNWGLPATGDLPVTATTTVADIIDITATANDPDAAVALANTLISTYADQTREKSNQTNRTNLKFTEAELAKRRYELTRAQLALKQFKEKYNIFDVTQELQSNTSRIAALQQAAEAARLEAESGEQSSTVQNDPTAIALRRDMETALAFYNNQLRLFFPSAPEAVAAKQAYVDASQQYQGHVGRLVASLRDRSNKAQSVLNAAQIRAQRLPELEFQLKKLDSNVTRLETVVAALGQQQVVRGANVDVEIATAEPIAPAVAATILNRTWGRALAMGLLVGLTLAALMAALLEQLDTSLHGREDVEGLHGAPVLGVLPLLKKRQEKRLSHLKNAPLEAPGLLEAFRILRSNLTFASVDAPLRSVMITSADPGEGKSLTALNLATVLAMDGRQVLLLDCDLRHPEQHNLHNAPLDPGLSDVLTGQVTLDDALRMGQVPNLSLMLAGTSAPNPPELLNSQACRRIFEELQTRCDILVVDAPPVLALSDAQTLGNLVDGIVIVAAADDTPRPHLQRAQAVLRHAGAHVLGVVLNKVRGVDPYPGSYYGNVKGKKKLPMLGAGKR